MSLIDTLARLEAVGSGRAQAIATVRHRHLSARPWCSCRSPPRAVAPARRAGRHRPGRAPAAGRAAAPGPRSALHVPRRAGRRDPAVHRLLRHRGGGRRAHRDRPGDRQAGQGRDGTVRGRAPADRAEPGGPGVRPAAGPLHAVPPHRRTGPGGALSGAAPGAAARALAHPLRERSRVPGSALLLALTDVLSRHWATGQSGLEDQHLGALLAWLDPRRAAAAPRPRGPPSWTGTRPGSCGARPRDRPPTRRSTTSCWPRRSSGTTGRAPPSPPPRTRWRPTTGWPRSPGPSGRSAS